MSERVRTWAPRMKPLMPVPIEEPSWYHRRVLRSLKKVFQSRWSGVVCAVVEEEAVSWEGGGVLTEEAYLTIEIELGVVDLKATFRFTSGTRLLWCCEESLVRRGTGDVVW